MPAVCHDDKNPNDIAITPHELTHAPDALRYFCDGLPMPAEPLADTKINTLKNFEEEMEEFNDFNGF